MFKLNPDELAKRAFVVALFAAIAASAIWPSEIIAQCEEADLIIYEDYFDYNENPYNTGEDVGCVQLYPGDYAIGGVHWRIPPGKSCNLGVPANTDIGPCEGCPGTVIEPECNSL